MRRIYEIYEGVVRVAHIHIAPVLSDEEYWQADFAVELVHVRANRRGKGLASQLLDQVCADADAVQASLALCCDPILSEYGLGYDELVEVYRRRGFEFFHEGDHMTMRRPPS